MDTHSLYVGICIIKNQLLKRGVCSKVEETTSKKGLLLKERICSPKGAYSLLPKGSIFFLLKGAPVRIENNYKGCYIENRQNLTLPICHSFKIVNFDSANIKWFSA